MYLTLTIVDDMSSTSRSGPRGGANCWHIAPVPCRGIVGRAERYSAKYYVEVIGGPAGVGQLVWSDRVDHIPSDVTCHQSSFSYISPCAIVSAGVEYAKP